MNNNIYEINTIIYRDDDKEEEYKYFIITDNIEESIKILKQCNVLSKKEIIKNIIYLASKFSKNVFIKT